MFFSRCSQCQTETCGLMTSADGATLTIIFECPVCQNIWSEEKPLMEDPPEKEA